MNENNETSRKAHGAKFWVGVVVLVVAVAAGCVILIIKSYPKTRHEQILSDLDRASELLDAQDYKRAAIHYSRAIELEIVDANRARLYSLRGICFYNQRKLESAIQDFSKALSLDPTDWKALDLRLSSFQMLEEYQLALEDADALVRLRGTALAFERRAILRFILRDLDGAMEDISETIRLVPNYSMGYETRSVIWYWKGNYQAALNDLEEAVRTSPLTLQKGAYDLYVAPEKLAEFLATCPDAQFRDGHRATELATTACNITSWQEPECLDTLASAYAETGDFEKAVTWQRKAIELAPAANKKKYQQQLEKLLKNEPIRFIPSESLISKGPPKSSGKVWLPAQ